ncbi:hypothetical protein N9Y68_06570 [Luminiphilus sp.]|nr:hypothetical protein [Luminiphilus sp.]
MTEIDEYLREQIVEQFHKWIAEGKPSKFSASYLMKNCNPVFCNKYKNQLTKKTGFWAEALQQSQINPDLFVSAKFKNIEQAKPALIEAIRELETVLGVENLNDGSMNQTKVYVPLPASLRRYSGGFAVSDRYELEPQISLAAFQRRCFKAFGGWDAALSAAGVDLDAVKRRVATHTAEDILFWFDRFVGSQGDDWSATTIKDRDQALFRAIGNHSSARSADRLPYAHISDEYIFSMWLFWKSWQANGSMIFEEAWWLSHESHLRQEFENKHRLQERWSLDRLQESALLLYSLGSNLDREDLEKRQETAFLATSRRYSDTGGESQLFERVGILTDNLSSLDSILSDLPLQEVSDRLRSLVGQSLEDEVNLLSREAMLKSNKETFYAALRWFNRFNLQEKIHNDWSKTLQFFGLNPNVFELAASKRAKRGIAFQRFFENLLVPHFNFVSKPEYVTSIRDVCADQAYGTDACSHSIRCRPDFVFKDLIIDTKVGGSLAKPEQLGRYLEHKSRVYVVTLNDAEKEKQIGDGFITVISFASFVAQSLDLIGIDVPNDSIDKLNVLLRQESLFSPTS